MSDSFNELKNKVDEALQKLTTVMTQISSQKPNTDLNQPLQKVSSENENNIPYLE